VRGQTESHLQSARAELEAARVAASSLEPQRALARSEAKRSQQLFEKKMASQSQRDQAETQLQRVEREVRMAAANLEAAEARVREAEAERARLEVLAGQLAVLETREAELAARLGEFPNLVVLRTLSKAYALAGARLGTLIAAEEIVALLRRIIPPYALPAATVEQVLALTEAPQRAMAADRIRTLLGEREAARARLARMAIVSRVFPSDANFLLVEFRDAQRALAAAKAEGLLVRDFSSAAGLANCLRISIGTPAQNERLLSALERA